MWIDKLFKIHQQRLLNEQNPISFHIISFTNNYNQILLKNIKNIKHKSLPKSKLGVVLIHILWCIRRACQSIHGSYDA
jgi:hypothetical protein